ncbi:MAG TPA: ribosome biogenesis GTP-binding protein YihA/YsxC [Cytophagales bacterium]|nr:ribosome biogenesis GTP-binding protein YihA/YsxC [Cytophagales bacterium]
MGNGVKFIKSTTQYKDCPPPDKPEYAFIGRSNVGKSSLINMLTGVKNLAKVSSKPGKTQLINHFLVTESWYLVDLPGYGWAKVSRVDRDKWEKMVRDYLQLRENLMNVFLLIDSRIEPQKNDLEFLNWLGSENIPFSIVFTKCDKQSKSQTNRIVNKFLENLTTTWEELPDYFVSSTETNLGKEEILKFIESVNVNFK